MWRTGLLYLDRGDSAIISALRDAGYNTQQTPGSPTRRFSTASSDTEIVWERRVKPELSPPAIQHWVVPADGSALKFSRPRTAKADDVLGHLSPSPASESTLFEEPPSYSLDQIKEDEHSPDDYFNVAGLEKSPSFKGDRDESLLPQTRRIRQQRTPSSLPASPSIASTLSSAQRLSRVLPARAKTNDGLLQLQADATKPPRPAAGHQRRISLGLPIKSALTAIDEPKQLSPPPQYVPPARPSSSSRKSTTALIQQERELEYKHRHTFIGTASLDDFLEVLDVTPTHSTTKAAVVRAFLLLASSERLLARQASLTPSGWGLIARTTSDTVNADYVEQAHAKLGSIVLRQFLDLIPFSEDDEAAAVSVMEAFSAAAHLDAKASTGNGSKAKAFRSWLVRHQGS